MDPNTIKNINIDSSINHNDFQLLQQLCSTNMPKMTAKERNNLMAKLSSNTTLNEIPKKELKDMNENEKKNYRYELKQKLKNKQNEKKRVRLSFYVDEDFFKKLQRIKNYKDSNEFNSCNTYEDIFKMLLNTHFRSKFK